MKRIPLFLIVVILAGVLLSCNKNYYGRGGGKAARNCGCPGQNVR
jgi:hypothetical protein